MKSVIPVLTFALVLAPACGEDVSDILDQISSEKASKAVNSTAIQPVKTPGRTEKRREPNTEAPKTKSKRAVEQPERKAPPQSLQIVVYRPKDKLPKNVAGSGVAGDFLVTGEDVFGGATIIAADDAMNPFARRFIIKNASSGYSPGTVLPLDNYKCIHISPQRPLIFIRRGIIPGEYEVRTR